MKIHKKIAKRLYIRHIVGVYCRHPNFHRESFTTEDYAMQITDIKVRKLFEDGPMKAIVSVTFDGQLAVHDIKVINARDKYFIVMPSRKNPDETFRDIVHPINSQFRSVLEKAVIAAYQEALENAELEAGSEDPAEV